MVRIAIGGWGPHAARSDGSDLYSFPQARRLANQMKNGNSWGDLTLVDDGEQDYTVVFNEDKEGKHDPKTTILIPLEPWWAPGTQGAWGRYMSPIPNPRAFFSVITGPCAFWSASPLLTYEAASLPVTEVKQDSVSSCPGEKYCLDGHIRRIDLIRAANGLIHSYGRAGTHGLEGYIGTVAQSIDAIRPYKYYFMCENAREKGYITEKLWEPIICETLCFYDGAPDAHTYVDADAFVPVDASNVEETLSIMRRAIAEDWWSQRVESIRKMKDKVLNELQIWPQVERVIKNQLNPGIELIGQNDDHEWEFLDGMDAEGNDICQNRDTGLSHREAARMLGMVCAAYNTYGYLKHSTPNLYQSQSAGMGIWIRKENVPKDSQYDSGDVVVHTKLGSLFNTMKYEQVIALAQHEKNNGWLDGKSANIWFRAALELQDLEACYTAASYFEYTDLDDNAVTSLNLLSELCRKKGFTLVGSTDLSYEPADNEKVFYYGPYPVTWRQFGVEAKSYCHANFYDAITHDKFISSSCWSHLDAIYIVNLKTRTDRRSHVLAELAKVGAPLDNIVFVFGERTLNPYIGCGQAHLRAMRNMQLTNRRNCLVVEDDIVFSRVPEFDAFFQRNYKFDVCFLATSRWWRREPFDDLLIRTFQSCTTASAYLLTKDTVGLVADCVEEGIDIMKNSGDTNEGSVDCHWRHLQSRNQTFVFKNKICFQRPDWSNNLNSSVAHYD